jgi:murein DD-endopeptidase MepM/ murein hydrolase activator NlpD
LDIALPEGSPLHAVADGIIDRITDYGSQAIGKGVIMDVGDKEVIYGHMSRITVRPGEHVHVGDVIGYSGNTGHSTGPHLHLGLRENGVYEDPTPFAGVAIGEATTKHHGWNPFGGLQGGIDHLNNTLDSIGKFFHQLGYWLNPVNLWHELDKVFSSGALDTPLIVATIAGILLLMGGAKWPKRWILWGWVIFWILRAGVFG